jgi:hypothetical protein
VLGEEEVARVALVLVAGALLFSCSQGVVSGPVIVDVGARSAQTSSDASASAARTFASGSAHAPPAGGIAWSHDLEASWSAARDANKPLFVYVRAAWNAASVDVERTTLLSPAVARAARPYVPVYVDITDDDVLARVEARLGKPVGTLPGFVLVDPRTQRRHAVEGTPLREDQLADALGDFVSGN